MIKCRRRQLIQTSRAEFQVSIYDYPDKYLLDRSNKFSTCQVKMDSITFLNNEVKQLCFSVDNADSFINFLKEITSIQELTLKINFKYYYNKRTEFWVKE